MRISGARLRGVVHGDKSMDRSAPSLGNAPAPSTMIDSALRIGLVAPLGYARTRIVLPFVFILMWSAILAVMLYLPHLRLAARLGDCGSALLIGLIGVAVTLGPMVILVTSLATSPYSLALTLQRQDVMTPPPPPWLDGAPLVGKKAGGDLDTRRHQPALFAGGWALAQFWRAPLIGGALGGILLTLAQQGASGTSYRRDAGDSCRARASPWDTSNRLSAPTVLGCR